MVAWKEIQQMQKNGYQNANYCNKFILLIFFSFIGLAVFLGCFHGLMLTPIVYVQDTDPNHSNNGNIK